MKKIIVIESSDIEREENKCTLKQFQYIRDLMYKNHYVLFLDKLGFDGKNRLTKLSASKLINCLVNSEDFELRQLKG